MKDIKSFASEWETAWNAHDLERTLSHYRDDIVFRSLKAIDVTGSGEVKGKAALRVYWQTALERQPDLKFQVQEVFEGHGMLVITYLNHKNVLAAETLYFDQEGLVYKAAACHADNQDD
ncbi:MAG: nuclear transport factor 2 family protein [Alphaproteobacteria bacterium]|nr:MAG: nuclear transport factor 2 family protein [Alphaproteobacteria bacterium]